MTQNPARKALADAVADGRLRKPVADGFAGVLKAIRDTGMPKRSREMDAVASGMKAGYWASAIEMTARAFEAHVIHKLAQGGGVSDYLANVLSKEAWDVLAPAPVKDFGNDSTYPYPTEAEIGAVSAAFDALFGAIETRQTERGVEMHMRERPVVTLSGTEMTPKKGIEALREAARRYFRERLMGLTVDSKALGPVKITNRGMSKTLATMADPDKARLVPAITAVLRHGRLANSVDAVGKEARVRRYHYVTAPVEVDGRRFVAGITVEERTDGSLYYNINSDGVDARPTTDRGARATNRGRAGRESRVGNIVLAPDEINLDLTFGDSEPQASPLGPAQVRAATAAVNREIGRSGLGPRVTGRVVEGLLGALGQPILGRATGATIEVNAEAADPAAVARHEIVHVLRDSALWGRPYGLFDQEEWRSLVRAARADKPLMDSIAAAYPDLDEAGRIEEAVAEMYREWAQGREGRGPLARLFERMCDFFRAVGAALTGEGLNGAADVMKRMERGEIGRRSRGIPEAGTNGLVVRDMAASPSNESAWRRALDLFRGGLRKGALFLGDDYPVFERLSRSRQPLMVDPAILGEIQREHPEITDAVLRNIAGALRDPDYVFRGARTEQNWATVVRRLPDGRALVVAIRPNDRAPNRQKAHTVRSAYIKEDAGWLEQELASDRLLYARLMPAGPRRASGSNSLSGRPETTNRRDAGRILTAADVFKDHVGPTR